MPYFPYFGVCSQGGVFIKTLYSAVGTITNSTYIADGNTTTYANSTSETATFKFSYTGTLPSTITVYVSATASSWDLTYLDSSGYSFSDFNVPSNNCRIDVFTSLDGSSWTSRGSTYFTNTTTYAFSTSTWTGSYFTFVFVMGPEWPPEARDQTGETFVSGYVRENEVY